MRLALKAIALAGVAVLISASAAAAQAVDGGAAPTVMSGLAGKPRLSVTSPAFRTGGDIPLENTLYGANRFPGLAWSAGPAGTRSYVLIMQDGDYPILGRALMHASMFNIPAGATRLDAGLTAPPAGASFGPNFHGANQPYAGPRPPPGPRHRFHFQILALDTVLGPEAGANYPALTAAFAGHVLAIGEVIGAAEADPKASQPLRPLLK